MTIKAIIFDLGGTLLHYHDPQSTDPRRHFRRITLKGFSAVIAHLNAAGVTTPLIDVLGDELDRQIREKYLADVEAQRGGSIEEPMYAALRAASVSMTDEQWHAAKAQFYTVIDEIVTPRSGVPEVLAVLSQAGYQLGLISNTYWSSRMHDRHLKEHDLLQYLPTRIYSSDSPYMKPHPGIFSIALEAMDVQAGHAVYVGDRIDVDVGSAQQVGMSGILIASPYRSEAIDGPPPKDVKPDATINELTDLPEAIRKLEKRHNP